MHRDLPRHVLARRGVVALVVMALIGVAVTLRSNGTFGAKPQVTAVVADAGGALRKGSDVKLDGVVVGKVSSVERDESGGVAVEMEMSEDDLEHIPANVVARILPATVFGTTFVDLVVHGSAAEERLEVGAEIPADTTQGTLEFQQALDDIDRLVKALGPAELASAIGSSAQALQGRGDQIASNVNALSSYLARLNPRMPALREDLAALAASVQVMDETAPALLDATEDALVFTGSLIHQEAALTELISGGLRLTETSTGFVTRNQRRLVQWIRGTGNFVDVLYDYRRVGITDAMAINEILGGELAGVIKNGYIQSDGVMVTELPEYYGRGDRPSFRSMVGQAG